MNLTEGFILEFEELSDDEKKEVITFIELLKKNKKERLYKLMDRIIEENMESLKELAK